MKYVTSLQTVRCLSRGLLNPARICLGVVIVLGLGVMPVRATTIVVHVFDFDFSTNPPGQPIVDPTIHLGDTIRWVGDEGFHTATSAAGQLESWDSDFLGPGDVFEHTFTHLGIFNYYCLPHGADLGGGHVEGMAGSITVVPITGVPDASSTLPLLGAALGGLTWLGRRRRRGEALT